MAKWTVDEEGFLKDVSKHEMHVLHDDGIYRHLRFRKPNSADMHFDIVTYPGYLVYSGDMGCYVFSRIQDMFQFFRCDTQLNLPINPHYWSEKVDAQDRDGVKEFSHEKFRENVERILKENEATEDCVNEVRDHFLDDCEEYSGEELYRAVYEFNYRGFRFQDFWDVNCDNYTGRFLWCCYAIVWGIKQYDTMKFYEKVRKNV